MAGFEAQARRPERPEARAGTVSTAPVSLPSVSLPKGGGAIRGIGEKFSANPATGTGAMSVPIATSPGRSGFGPQLSLSYDSGRGNGPFGFGWGLSVPAITRKTDQGLPRYDGSDGFVLSGAEDLVPVPGGGERDGHRVDRFRPRVEGEFARIERWTRLADGDVHWRSISKANVASVYGQDAESRIADPADPGRVFSWLLCASHDDRGNAIGYGYVADDDVGVDVGQAHERHRSPTVRGTNRYLKRIRYGNRVSRLADPTLAGPGWMFEVVFDYGDHDLELPTPVPDRPWPVRADPFSSYRPGFEVRSYRLCRRVLMFHHFPDEPGVGADCLVRSTTFGYQPGEAVGEFLTEVIQHGHRRVDDGYLTRSMPPLELAYSPAELRDEVREVDADSLAGAPAGLAGDGYQWVDLDGEGISGILATQASGWFYKANLGGGRFGAAQAVSPVPSLASAAPRLLDLAGDGQLDLVVLDGPNSGFFERDAPGKDWERFVPFEALPVLDWDDPNLRFVDLDGDGHADVLVTEDQAFTWYRSRAEAGFEPAQTVTSPRMVFADGTGSVHLADMSGDGLADLVRIRNGEVCYWPNLGYGRFGAKVVMDGSPTFDRAELFDPTYLRLADVDGSGVTDLIYLGPDGAQVYLNRSGNGWNPPRLVTTAPRADNRRHVTTVDLLGTGTICLVWSADQAVDARRSLHYIDLHGSVKPHLLVRVVNNLGGETQIRYASSTRFYLADRAAGRPWLSRLPFPVQVVERVETRDRISRNRFVTRYAYHHGHFDAVEREFRGFGMVEQWDTEDLSALGGDVDFEASNEDPISQVPPVLTRTWFHTGTFAGGAAGMSRQFEADYWQEPGLTPEQQRALLLEDTPLPQVLRLPDGTAAPHQPTAEEVREACRALRGRVLREEVYAQDGSERSGRPYRVTERNYTVELLQPRLEPDRHAVCYAYPRETVTHHYERALYGVDGALVADPRVSHEATLDIDGYGNVVRSATVGYGRRHPDAGLDPRLPAWARDAVRTEQARLRATLTVNQYTNPTDTDADYRTPLPCETITYELVNLPLPAPPGRLGYRQLRELADAAGDGAHELPFEHIGATGPSPWRRPIEHVRTLYRRDDLTGPLPLGQAQPLGLAYEHYQLAFTPGLVSQVYRRTVDGGAEDLLPDPAAVLEPHGGYVSDPDGWWLPSGRLLLSPDPAHDVAQELAYARAHFFLPGRMRDPFGAVTTLTYDRYDLLVAESRDPLDNRLTVGERGPDGTLTAPGHDYRVLQPRRITDPNRNRSEVAFDALGRVAATAVMGKPGQDAGDSLAGLDPDPPESVVAGVLADPLADPGLLLGTASNRYCYDLRAYWRTREEAQPQPAAVYTAARETHAAALAAGEPTRVQHRLTYHDGFEREIQRKIPAEPGPLAPGEPAMATRWVGSGWTVFNSKGDPVRQYEPFFSDTPSFEREKVAGVSPVLLYDPARRVLATVHPDRTIEKAVFDPWHQAAWDRNDMVLVADPRTDPDVGGFLSRLPDAELVPSWHAERINGGLGEPERAAAQRSEVHAGTPSVLWLDSLGRPFLTVAHNTYLREGVVVDERYPTLVRLDITGHEREVVDARGRPVMRYQYDLLGNRIHQASMDAGDRWTLGDVTDQPIYGWDTRGHRLRTGYDRLRRPTEVRLRTAGAPELLVGRTEYGEAQPDAELLNLRGEILRSFDSVGVATHQEYDFKGNLLRSSRQLVSDHRTEPDWSSSVPLEPVTYRAAASYDALDRPVTVTAPDQSVVSHSYNEANLLSRVEVRLPGDPTNTVIVANVDYDAKGQRTLVEYGNGATTSSTYDPVTFRLTRLLTRRGAESLQDLAYTYDPQGHLTHLRDRAQQTVFFRNQRVDPDAEYVYDAVYRLVEATGREHLGQNSGGQVLPPSPASHHDAPRVGLPHPGDGAAMGRYSQGYRYDEVGNLLSLAHRGTDPANPGWTRTYQYGESDRLASTQVGELVEPYQHDPHGNLTSMPHLPLLRWDHHDRLRATSTQVTGGTPETTWYGYDPENQRARKVTDRQAPAGGIGARRAERIYLGGFEVHREYGGDGVTVTRERTTLHVMDDEQRIALIETRTVGDDPGPARLVRYQLDNHLGSACLELDDQAQIISYEEYTPYGSSSYQAVAGQVETPKRYRFAGRERDEETGLCYHGARYYAPWLGRWASADPAGLAEGTNLYAYAVNNAVNRVDPDGTQSFAVTPDLEATLRFVVNEAGFAQGNTTPPNPDTHNRTDASRFGTHAHNRELGQAIRRAQDLRLPHAGRLVEGVRVNAATGQVTHIGVPPGGRGTLNFDLVYLRDGATLQVGDTLQSKAQLTGDAKYGGIRTNQAQAAFARRHGLAHVDLRAGNFHAQVSIGTKAATLAKAKGGSIKKQGGFVRIDALGFIAIATTAGIIIASEDRLDAAIQAAKGTAASIPLGIVLTKLAGSATLGGLLTMVVTMESDNAAHNEAMAKMRMINDFIFENFPGVVDKYRYCLYGVGWPCTGWQYQAKDAKRYSEIYTKIESLLADPYEFD